MRTRRTWLGLLAAILAAAVLWWQQGDGALTAEEPADTASSAPTAAAPSDLEPSDVSPTTTAPSASTAPPTAPESTAPPEGDVDPGSGLPLITTTELPAEAIDTLELISAGGPYPYEQDDSVFQNREGILPDQPEGYYREYTVETPGSDDRGARRIVAGSPGEYYWTEDHYASFARITE